MVSLDAVIALLDQPGPWLAAWDVNDRPVERRLDLHCLASGGAERRLTCQFPPSDVAAVTAALQRYPVQIGHGYGVCDFVWVASPEALTVWHPSGKILTAGAVYRDTI
jgi:hypothetical protein